MTRLPRREHFRDSVHFAVAVATELAAPVLRLGARAVSRRAPSRPHRWRRALIIGHGHIGDVLCQTASLHALAGGLPECSFDYLTTPLAAEVLRGNPFVHEVHPWNTAPRPDAVSTDSFRALLARDYDAVLCTNVVRHHEALRLAIALRIPNRVAFVHRGFSALATIPIRLERPLTPPAQSRLMAETITGRHEESELRPRMYPDRDDATMADRERARLGLGAADTILACAVTTRQTIGRVPEHFFADILGQIQRTAPGVRIVLCGSAHDAVSLERVAASLPHGALLSAGRLGLSAFQVFLARTSGFFGMDSGPRHIANAAGVPVIFVRNMAVREAEAGAYCPTELDIAPPGDFRTASEITRTLASIDVSDVANRIISLLRDGHAGPGVTSAR